MLVVKLEIWPFGEKAARRELGRITIANVGGTDVEGRYEARASGEADRELHALTVPTLRHKRPQGAWLLVYKALGALVYGSRHLAQDDAQRALGRLYEDERAIEHWKERAEVAEHKLSVRALGDVFGTLDFSSVICATCGHRGDAHYEGGGCCHRVFSKYCRCDAFVGLEGGVRAMSANQDFELAENSVLYWLLVAYRSAHIHHFESDEATLRSAERDANFRLRTSNNPYDRKIVKFLRSISTRLIMVGDDQTVARAARLEMKLSIYQYSDAFASLGAIPCRICGHPASEHFQESLVRGGRDIILTQCSHEGPQQSWHEPGDNICDCEYF